MARSLSNAKFLVASFGDNLTRAINRRGYAAAATQGSVSAKGGSMSGMEKKEEETEKVVIKEDSSWGPDPITGYYRPGNRAVDIDVVELRDNASNVSRLAHNNST